MYLEMFGFTEKPFHITPNPRFIFLSQNHKEAFAHLLYGIQHRVGFLSLSGEIGTGKTTVLRTLLGQLEEAEYRVALIFNPCLTDIELLQTIHREFSISSDSTDLNLVDLHDSLNRFLLQQRELGKTVVLVIDEAQNLDPKVLEQLRLLSNLETETEKLIQIVLVGQPELDDILQRKALRQLRQRLAVRYHLQSMDAEDTQAYVLHRLKIAGCKTPELFSTQTLTQVYALTQGTPRLINLLCDRALLVAYGRDSQVVTKADLQVAQKELQFQQKTKAFTKFSIVGVVLLLLILTIFGLKLTALTPATVAKPEEQQKAVTTKETEVAVQSDLPSIQAGAEKKSVAAEVDEQRVQFLIQQLAELTVEDTARESAIAIATSWNLNIPEQLPVVNDRKNMASSLSLIGFDVVEVQGSVTDMLTFNVPVVLEMPLPGFSGKRFLTILNLQGDRVKTSPSLTEDGWLSIIELQQLWFGKALLPYLNVQAIPFIGRLGDKGNSVTDLQRMINAIEPGSLGITGIYDQKTLDFVARFQRRMNLAPDGRVGAHSLFWLYLKSGYKMPFISTGAMP